MMGMSTSDDGCTLSGGSTLSGRSMLSSGCRSGGHVAVDGNVIEGDDGSGRTVCNGDGAEWGS